MAFDVNSLGGKLIDNQNLAKALAEGGGGSGGGIKLIPVQEGGFYKDWSGSSAIYYTRDEMLELHRQYGDGLMGVIDSDVYSIQIQSDDVFRCLAVHLVQNESNEFTIQQYYIYLGSDGYENSYNQFVFSVTERIPA